jgi:phage FluMu gp28-like protein
MNVLPEPAERRPFEPFFKLLPYQRDWADDQSRWKFGLMSRQVGKDFAAGFEGIRDCLIHDRFKQKTDWLIAAPSERQSLESLEKWKRWAECLKVGLASYEEQRGDGAESLLQAAILRFQHGSRVIAVPGKPDTVRGFSANVVLTEFAFFEQPDETWRAILPSITNPLRGGVKKVRLITTPNGLGNKAHEIWLGNYAPAGRDSVEPHNAGSQGSTESRPTEAGPAWSCHLVDIHRAVQDGLPVNIEELRAALNDPEGWAQEFECQFLDIQTVLLPYDLIAACESSGATLAVPSDYWRSARPLPLVMGLDFGRRHDLTVAWTLARMGDVWQTIEVLTLEKMPTDQQVEILRPRIRRCGRVCLDYTGPGVGLGDYLAKEFRACEPDRHRFGKIERCNFTNTLKVDIFSKLRMAFENRALRVPVSRDIREDLHSLTRVSTATGQISYRAQHSADGHADRCTALALALRAGGDGPVRSSAESVPRRRGPNDLGVAGASRRQWPL